MRKRTPVHTERRQDAIGEYEEQWMVKPPPEDTPYRVLDDSWSEDYSVRTIRHIALLIDGEMPCGTEPWKFSLQGLVTAVLPDGALSLSTGERVQAIGSERGQRGLIYALEQKAQECGASKVFLSECCSYRILPQTYPEGHAGWRSQHYCYAAFVLPRCQDDRTDEMPKPRIWNLRADGGFDGPPIGPSLRALIDGKELSDEAYEEDGVDVIEMTSGVRVYGVWEHDYDVDELVGLFWRKEDAEAKAATNPKGNLPGTWPDSRGSWIVEEHEIT